MTDHDDANEYLMGSGAPSISWRTAQPGHSVTGTVARPPRLVQQRAIEDGTPQHWPDGKPKMQLVVNLATELRDPGDPADDGERSLYVKGKSMTDALRAAVRATSGGRGIEVGGRITVTYTGEGPRTNPRFNPPKLFDVSYTPPAYSPDQALMEGTTGLGALRALDAPPVGIDPAAWQAMPGDARARVLAAIGGAGGTSPTASAPIPF